MSRRTIVIIVGVLAGITLLGAFSGDTKSVNNSAVQYNSNANSGSKDAVENAKSTCDGTIVTTNCELNGVNYKTYIYHPAVAEKSHTEEVVTSYKQEIIGYCTLCNDGTYSPSCATGRGACSYHGGVAQWNAPEYENVPVYETRTIVDTPAQEAYYEKVVN